MTGVNSTVIRIGEITLSMLSLIASIVALFLAISLTNITNDVSTKIAENDRLIASDNRCVEALVALRGKISELAAGYEMRPLDRDSRLEDWRDARNSLDASSLACVSQLSRFEGAGGRYVGLANRFADEYLAASDGRWESCLSDSIYLFAEDLANAVLYPETTELSFEGDDITESSCS